MPQVRLRASLLTLALLSLAPPAWAEDDDLLMDLEALFEETPEATMADPEETVPVED